ncbi:hypothetical protein BJX76DRAFT_365229 [Aspergillus varians]
MDAEIFQYIFHHVILPPKLPGEPERKQKPLERELMRLVKEVLASFVRKRPHDIQKKWESAVNLIDIWLSVDAGGLDLNRHQELLTREIKNLRTHGAIALYVCAQNCGWLAQYDKEQNKIIIDAFEVSSSSADVLRASGPLIRCFPGQSVALPAAMVDDLGFCKYLSHNLCRLNLEVVRDLCPKAAMSRDSIEETWDTVHPGLITEGLMVQLLAFGEHNVHKSFEKHVRDEVNYDDAKLPWRRSPLWFVIKVALQTILYRVFPGCEGRTEYKNFMLYLVAEIGSVAERLEIDDIADTLAIMRAKVARRACKLQHETLEFVLERRLQRLHLLIRAPGLKAIPQSFGPHSEDYLRDAMMHRPLNKCPRNFNRTHKKRNQRQTSGLPRLEDDADIVTLLDFEVWIDTHLQSWRVDIKPTDKVCCDLAELIQKYSDNASTKYAQMPDALSLMILAIMELWVSLDSLCVQVCPLLRDFSPEIPKKFIWPLLLPHGRHMQRAQKVEEYILLRYQAFSSSTPPSVFDDPGPGTFAARYYDRSPSYKRLHQDIMDSATLERDNRRKLWEERSKKYQDLLSQSSELSHELEFNEWGKEHHPSDCEKCLLERSAASLQIEVHEWPLPNDENVVKNVVFELSCPRWFAQWRDITWMIIDDHGRPQAREHSKMDMKLLEYPATKHFASNWGQRLIYASRTNPWLKTHYRTQSFPNEVLADQRNCHSSITLQEMSTFGHLRSGEHLQWYNMIRELASPFLSTNKESVHKLFCQAAWELGSSNTETRRRNAHVFFEELSSVNKLLKSLEDRLSSISTNWNEYYTLHTIVILGLRALTLCPSPAIERTASFLQRYLAAALETEVGPESDAQLALLFKIGGICLLTFAVEDQHLPALLESDENFQILARSAIIFFQNTPKPIEDHTLETKTMVLQVTGVLRHAEKQVSQLIEQGSSALDNAVQQTAHDIHFISPWRFDGGDNMRWATNETASTFQGHQQEVRYNILSGELLIDNQSPSRLPEDCTKHPIFQRLFGQRTLSVVPSSLEGSTFMSMQLFENHKNAEKAGQILRLIPHDILAEDFPDSLVTKHVHWLDLKTGILEFRPLDQAWQHSPRNWHMSFQHKIGEISTTKQGQRRLIDVHSTLFAEIANVLKSLDSPKNILVTLSKDGTIEAKLVRLRLNFFVNTDGALECREHRAIVDAIQDIGCLYGLSNKLVLRDKARKLHRTALIPYGTVRISKGVLHTEVSIVPPNSPRIRCFHYVVDSNLGILSDTTGIIGALYQAYLHAVTAFVLPDVATKRSGTEEALRILRQARIKSPFPLDCDCSRLLELIAALTPRRQYHLPSKELMQRAIWARNLVVQDIFNHSAGFAAFYDQRKQIPLGLDRGDVHLLNRARARHSRFHQSEFGGASKVEPVPPSEYDARDRSGPSSARGCHWPSTLRHKEDLFGAVKSWDQYTYTSLLDQCRASRRETETYKLISVFCTITFGRAEVSDLTHLLAIAFSGLFPEIPQQLFRGSMQLDLSPGQTPDKSELQKVISSNYPPYKSDFGNNPKSLSRSEKAKMRALQKKNYEKKKDQEAHALACEIINQWPGPLRPPSDMEPWQAKSFNDCDLLFSRCHKNIQFFQLMQLVQTRLDGIPISPVPVPGPPALLRRLLIRPRFIYSDSWNAPGLHDLLHSGTAPASMDIDESPLGYQRLKVPACSDSGANDKLRSLILGLRKDSDDLRQKYADNLLESLDALKKVDSPSSPVNFPVEKEALVQHHERLSEQRDILWAEITSALTTVDDTWDAVGVSTLWPSITVLSIISFLAADKWNSVPDSWKGVLLMFAKTISSLRRCERLLEHFDKGDVNAFYKEAETIGCEGWEPSEIPDWLLLEIESDLTIRERQAEVAQRMITPDTQENSVLQLNMGEGKTTVITPMIAAYLSNGSQLVRIIVLKPLLRQSVDLLSQRLGGLLNRPVYYIPSSRSTLLKEDTVGALKELYFECQQKRGILIVLPEQLLSFRLVGLDLATFPAALSLIEIEKSLQDECRTIIDESDEVLDAKFQLIYTRGNQQNVDGESDRWEVIQYVLGVVEKYAASMHLEDQNSLSIEQQDIRYPILHFLEEGAPDLLLQKVIDAVAKGEIPGLPFHQWPLRLRDSSLKFVRSLETSKADEDIVREAFQDSIILKKLLVLRGLFAYHILHFTLAGKRWLVDYGVHPSRCLMAVPFRAKGVPSESSEFGHSDVALTLTCLSYYYSGLTEYQVRRCFYLLMKENDPAAEYEKWTLRRREDLPTGLHSFNGVNLEDKQSFLKDLYPHLRYQKGIIDFFLSQVVFPKEAKEFPFKLSTSAWDIPSRPGQPLTTGFSGTNDNRYLLPKSMPQKDMPYLLHTNAMVLDQLLREENRQCVLAEDRNGRRLPVDELLRLINDQDPHINTGRAISSSFSHLRFEEEYIYAWFFLDQHHARGVDLKLPRTYRAAVTLGPRLTKDRLVQACHRMRELGNGQSVAFFIPPEVRHSLNKGDATITSYEVISWVLEQTCTHLDKLQPLWAWNGLQYFRCLQIWEGFREGLSKLEEITPRIQESESKSLSQLYAPWEDPPYSLNALQALALNNPTAGELLEKWKGAASATVYLHEEQEREITQEVQREQHVFLPPFVQPLKNKVHGDMVYFVKNGLFPRTYASDAVRPAFECLSRTSAGQFKFPSMIGSDLYASVDFLDTISQGASQVDDEFLKPVHWVLSNVNNQQLLIVSQFEANNLLPSIRASEKVALHMYAPRTTKDMCSFSKLDFLTIGKTRDNFQISPELIQALEIFSGSLYFDSFDEYQSACHFFGFKTDDSLDIPEDSVTSDGFVNEQARNQVGWPMNIRTKGHGFSQSHIGSIVEAQRLTKDRF